MAPSHKPIAVDGKGLRTPLWSCRNCPIEDNWDSRTRCRGCGDDHPDPRGARARAAKAAKAAQKGDAPWKNPPASIRQPAAGKQDKLVAQLQVEIAQLKKDAKAAAAASAIVGDAETESAAASPGAQRQKLLDEIKTLLALEEITEESPMVVSRRKQLAELDDARPIKAKLAVADKQRRLCEQALEKKRKQKGDLEIIIAEKTAAKTKVDAEIASFEAELSKLSIERAKLAAAGLAVSPAGAAGADKAAWDTAAAWLKTQKPADGHGAVYAALEAFITASQATATVAAAVAVPVPADGPSNGSFMPPPAIVPDATPAIVPVVVPVVAGTVAPAAGQALAIADGAVGGASTTAGPVGQTAAAGKNGWRVDTAALESVASACAGLDGISGAERASKLQKVGQALVAAGIAADEDMDL